MESGESESSKSRRGSGARSAKETYDELLSRATEDGAGEGEAEEGEPEGREKSDAGDKSEDADDAKLSAAATTRREKETESSEMGKYPGKW